MKNKLFYADKLILVLTLIIVSVSTLMIYSARSITSVVFGNGNSFQIFGRQLIFITLSIIVYFIVTMIPYIVFRRVANLLWFISFMLLIVVFAFPPINSSYSWIPLPFFNFQPAELAKIAVIIVLSAYYYNLHNKEEKITIQNGFLKPLAFVLLPFIAIFLQPDPGSGLILLLISLSILLAARLPLVRMLRGAFKVIVVIIAVILVGMLVNSVTNNSIADSFSKQQARMLGRFDYKDPCSDFAGSGFQICNSLIAVNTGGVLGKGVGNGTQKYLYLPESHTDAIIAVTAEELGFVGTSFILICYLILILRILYYARQASDLFAALICVGVAFMFLIHIFINIGGILNIIPFTGVPLPFFSYGGTFLMLCFGALGLVQSVAISVNREK